MLLPVAQVSLANVATLGGVLIAAGAALVARRSMRIAAEQADHARRAFLGSNFLTLMDKLQEEAARDARGRLKAHFRCECGYCEPERKWPRSTAKCKGHPVRWAGSDSSPPVNDADRAAQLFDQVGIMLANKMVDAAPILDNWGATILEIYIVALPVISDRRRATGNPNHWRRFDVLASEACENNSSPAWLKTAYTEVIASVASLGIDAAIDIDPYKFSAPREKKGL